MKKIFLISFVISFALFSTAQIKNDSSKHLLFKGVPIDGPLPEYVNKLKKHGYTHKGTDNGLAILEGEFATYKNCTIGVSASVRKNVVSKIVVFFPDMEKWSSLLSNYRNIQDLLSKKYGEPIKSMEEFQSGDPEDDGSKLIKVKLDECKYYSIYNSDKGIVQLSVSHIDFSRCFVQLVYFDKINNESEEAEALDDL